MSVAILDSRAQIGTAAPPVTIEVFLSGGLPAFSVVGMPATAVRESKDRVRSALISSGFRFPQERITVSLGPADMPKTGGRYDLAIALGILAASGQLDAARLRATEYYGELALDGALKRVPGVLPAALRARERRRPVVVPRDNAAEAALSRAEVYPAGSLLEVTAHVAGSLRIAPAERQPFAPGTAAAPDLADVRGQGQAKRALEIAAAGGHNLLFIGPPGTGKSMLAERLPGILPPLSEQEAIETAAVESVLGAEPDPERWRQRPFRAPHHTASAAALVGGGSDPRPGEISRAHNGVLFLDELPEFNRNVLEVLREPLEAGRIMISRAGANAEYPACFQLVAAMNPCPCGYLGDSSGLCACSGERVDRYRSRISGPLLDRIDLRVELGRPRAGDLRCGASDAEKSAAVRERVVAARDRQLDRQSRCNAALGTAELQAGVGMEADAWQVLDAAAERFVLSVRGYQRVIRVARTIADLDARVTITRADVAGALSLRGAEGNENSAARRRAGITALL